MQTGEIIGMLAKEKGINLHQLSIKADIPYNTLYAIVKRKSSRVDMETQVKIAKALGVHLRDLADTSAWEEFDQQHPDTVENAKRGLAVIQYLKEMGFTVIGQVLKWHYEDQVDESGKVVGQAQVADEFATVLSKDGHTATFTDAEFEELQAGAKEAIEGRFFKKVLEQQKK